MDDQTNEEPGFCECGCGERLPRVYVIQEARRKPKKRRFLVGHGCLAKTPDEMLAHLMTKTKQLENGCLNYTGKLLKHGRGQIRWKGKVFYVHRLSYELNIGPIPEGKCVCHSCDNPICINPEHLWLGTNEENVADMDKKGRRFVTRSEDSPSAKTTYETAEKIRKEYEETGKPYGSMINLARKYELTLKSLWKIIHNKTYTKPPQKRNI